MFSKPLSLAIAFLVTFYSSAFSSCPAAVIGSLKKSGRIVLLADKIFFRTSGLELDFDGNPHAYGVHDQGQEDICAGLAPLAAPCHGKYRGACYKACQQTFATWSRISGDPDRIPDTMCSVGLGGSSCSRPDVHLQEPPNRDWFVSETSVKTSPENGSIDPKWLHRQDAQLDPSQIRYLVAPGSLTQPPWKVQFGDVGIALNAARKEAIPFIVGDGGGLGEGAVSLLAALRPDAPPTLKPRTNALGNKVMRYTSGVGGDFRFVIFRATASRARSTGNVTRMTAAKLRDWITRNAMAAFKAQTSRDEILSCSARLPAIKK